MALLFELLFVRVLFGLLSFAFGILAALVGLVLEAVVLAVRHVAWPSARWLGRAALARVRPHGAGRGYAGEAAWDGASYRGVQSAHRSAADQASVLAGVRAALAARERY